MSGLLWGLWVLLVGFAFAFVPWWTGYALAGLGFS